MDVQKCELRGQAVMSGHARVGPPDFTMAMASRASF